MATDVDKFMISLPVFDEILVNDAQRTLTYVRMLLRCVVRQYQPRRARSVLVLTIFMVLSGQNIEL